MFENYHSFFHYCLLSCRYVVLEKSILNGPKWGVQAVVGGNGAPGPTVATAPSGPTVPMALATSTKNDTLVANFANS